MQWKVTIAQQIEGKNPQAWRWAFWHHSLGEKKKKNQEEWRKITQIWESVKRASIPATMTQEGLELAKGVQSIFKEIMRKIQLSG